MEPCKVDGSQVMPRRGRESAPRQRDQQAQKDPEASEGLVRSGSRREFLGVLWVRVEKTLAIRALQGA